MKNILILTLCFFIPFTKAEFLYPNTDVLEITIKLSEKQRNKFFYWCKKEFEIYEKIDRSLAGKALALCRAISGKDLFDSYFLNKAYGIGDMPKEVAIKDVMNDFVQMTNGSPDQQRLAWYIFDYLHSADPSEDLDIILKGLPKGNWEYLVPSLVNIFPTSVDEDPKPKLSDLNLGVPAAREYSFKPRHPARKYATVNGLIVSSMDNHRSIGAPVRISAKIVQARHESKAIFLDEETGMDMKRSLSNAEIALNSRFPVLFKDNNVRVSFARRESSKDGNSAGVAFTLLLYSLYEGIELDEASAVTGVIMPDLSVKAVGGVPSKVRGANIRGLKYVVIPHENMETVGDMTLLYELKTIWQTQIFTAENFSDAMQIARVDKDAKTADAIQRFNSVAEILDKGGKAIKENRSFLMSELETIVKLKPNHESAQVLLKFFKGDRPKRLSLNGSSDLLFMVVDRVLRISVNEAYKTSEDAFVYNKSFLQRAAKKLDPITARFSSKLSSYITTLIKYRNLLEKNIHKDFSSLGTAFSLLNKEAAQLEKTRGELDKIWKQIVKKM
ncbi:MAG: hypothetical protein MK132_01675 [Lentisphaerales bacterium]|nr:hypothetical protein [Lentisphaerales bacterium]